MLPLWTILAGLLGGCGEAPTVARTPPRQVELTEPWASLDLPVGDGRVVASDPTVLTVRYDGDRTEALAPGWRTAVRAAGAVEEAALSEPPLVSVRYRLEERMLALSVSTLDDATTVVLTLDGAAPPEPVD